MMRTLPEALSFFQQRVYHTISLLLPPINSVDSGPFELNHALHYVCQQPGKAIRPFLVYATGALFDTPMETLDPIACAVELIHLYSLIHDDLPAMDNDDLRRNQPTCHKAFTESTAILVGDGLQALAFQVLSDPQQAALSLSLSPEIRLTLIHLLAKAAGISGMVKGQAIDIASINTQLSAHELEHMHLAKTGALIEFSIHAAALVGLNNIDNMHNKKQLLADLINYARYIGLAFQIQDDLLDATATTEMLGKKSHKDALTNKPNFVSLFGIEKARDKAHDCIQQALRCLKSFHPERAQLLCDLTHYIVKREF